MDVSDIRYLHLIYVILTETESERKFLSHFEFRQLILESLTRCGLNIHTYDESAFLYTINRKILIYFPEFGKRITQSTLLLDQSLKCCILPIKIGYVIHNGTGICIVRIELPDLY